MSDSEHPPLDDASADEAAEHETSADESSGRYAPASDPSDDDAAGAAVSRDEAARDIAAEDRSSGRESFEDEIEAHAEDPDTMSPSVRRLVKQYDLDITGIHGSGPAGRVRVGDVMAVLGNRATQPREERQAVDSANRQLPVTCVFECDMSRVLAHQKSMRKQQMEIALPAYFMLACSRALARAPELNRHKDRIDLGFVQSFVGNAPTSVIVRDAGNLELAEINRRLAAPAGWQTEDSQAEDLGDASFIIYDHGSSGSLMTFPTPIVSGHRASLGIGRVRRAVVVKNVEGQDTARIAAQCHLGVSATAEAQLINEFLSECVTVLETYSTAAIASAT